MQGQPTSPADKALIIAAIDALMAGGADCRRACAEVGVEHWGKPLNHNNFYRWKKEAEGGKPAKPAGQKGRPVKFELTREETRRLRFWALVKDSIPLAVEAFIAEAIEHDDAHPYFVALREALMMRPDNGTRARPELATAMRAHWQAAADAGKLVSWPRAMLRACRVTEGERAHFRGRKASSSALGRERRGGFIIAEDGTQLPWAPGMIWESDDMSTNEPFKFFDAAARTEMTGRQMIATIDACALFWLGHDMIGRDRDSYRAEDIALHFRNMVDTHGLPLIWRIEKGRWDNDFIWGCAYGKSEDGKVKRWGGLDEIIHIRSKHESQGKANVEGGFDLLQAISAHGFDGRAQSIGRQRGEFERETRSMMRANGERPDAAELAKFWSITDASDAMARTMHLFNSRPKQRHNFDNSTIIPAQLWAQHVKRPLPGEHRWRFHAIKKKATVNKGIIKVSAPHYPQSFRFRLEGGHRTPNVTLANGHEVFIAFTPSEVWEGCHVFNRDSSARNRDGYGFGELIGVAEWMMDAPQEDLCGHGHSAGQKRASAQVRKETRTILSGSHFDGKRVRHAQDQFGDVKRSVSLGGMPQENPRPANTGAEAGTAGARNRADQLTDDELVSAPRNRRSGAQVLTFDLDEEEERRAMSL
ncbi:MAG: hypothetical protein V4662_13745 [Verrucomicrobiota bacterium]